jgi:DNA repair exonuclease SbcCD nuclease subunit
MPNLQPTPIMYFCSDLHLSHKPPVARAVEPDWYAAMRRPIADLAKRSRKDRAFVVCAGDIFHHWNEPVELVNWAARELPDMYSIPGQHDLPYHRYEDIEKSSYFNLCIQGTLHDLIPGEPQIVSAGDKAIWLWAYPWGAEIKPILFSK